MTTPKSARVKLKPASNDPVHRSGRSSDSGYDSRDQSPRKSISIIGLGHSPDSAYASQNQSPTKPIKDYTPSLQPIIAKLERLYDGSSSEASDSGHSNNEHDNPFILPKLPPKSNTPPRAFSRLRASLSESSPAVQKEPNHPRHGSDTAVTGKRISSLRTPDRFVPSRDPTTPGSEKMRTSKPPEDLTPSERLVRHNRDAPDPFCFRRKPLAPSLTAPRGRVTSRNGTVLDSASQNANMRRERQVRPCFTPPIYLHMCTPCPNVSCVCHILVLIQHR